MQRSGRGIVTKPTKTIARLFEGDSSGESQTVAKRIERRLEVLRLWLSDGIPLGKTIPSSLNATRLWKDQELGIESIRSPNDFTMTHHVHGRSVRDIAGLLTALRDRYGRPKKTRASHQAQVTKFDRIAIERALEAAVSQWHAERDQHLEGARSAASAEARSLMLLEENADKDRLIADLRRQLAVHQGLRVI